MKQVKLYFFGDKKVAPDGIIEDDLNKELIYIPYQHLKKRPHRKGEEIIDDSDDEIDIEFDTVKAGSTFAVFRDTRNKYFGIGNCSQGQMLNGKPHRYKRMKLLKMKHNKEKIHPKQMFVGKSNCLVVDSKRRIFGWGSSGFGQLGVDYLKENFVSSLSQVHVPSILRNAGTDKLIVNVTEDEYRTQVDNHVIGNIACGEGRTLVFLDYCLYSIGKKSSKLTDKFPLIMELSNKIAVRGMCCGWTHAACYDYDGNVYTWGSAKFGKLGHPNQYDVFKEDDREIKPRKVFSFDNMKIIGVALGMEYTLLLNNMGEIFMVGNMVPLRGQIKHELDYIRPVKCEPLQKQLRKSWMIRVRSGKNHAVCVDRGGNMYTFGLNYDGCLGTHEYSSFTQPKQVAGLQSMSVIDFDCGDNFTVAIVDAKEEFQFDSQMYRDFKYNSNHKIIRKIFHKKKLNQMKEKLQYGSDSEEFLEEEEEESFGFSSQSNIEGTLDTRFVKSYVLKENTVFEFNKAIVLREHRSHKIQLEGLVDRVKQFFGIIDFTKLPVHLLSMEEPERRMQLKLEIKQMVEDLCNNSKDFKQFMSKFNAVAKICNGKKNISFDHMFFKEILKNPQIKKIVPKVMKRDRKRDRKFWYRRKNSYEYGSQEGSQPTYKSRPMSSHLQSAVGSRSTTKVMMSSARRKELFDPVMSAIKFRYKRNNYNKLEYKAKYMNSTGTMGLSEHRLRRLRGSKLDKERMVGRIGKANERLDLIFENRWDDVRIRAEHKTIQAKLNKKRRVQISKKRKRKIRANIEKKFNKGKTLKELREEKIRLYKNWMEQWIIIHSFYLIMKKLKCMKNCCVPIFHGWVQIYQKHHLEERIRKMKERDERIKRCDELIKGLGIFHKACFVVITKRLKRNVAVSKARRSLTQIRQHFLVQKVKKNLRTALFVTMNKINIVKRFFQFHHENDERSLIYLRAQWDDFLLRMADQKINRDAKENDPYNYHTSLKIYTTIKKEDLNSGPSSKRTRRVLTPYDLPTFEDYHRYMLSFIKKNISDAFVDLIQRGVNNERFKRTNSLDYADSDSFSRQNSLTSTKFGSSNKLDTKMDKSTAQAIYQSMIQPLVKNYSLDNTLKKKKKIKASNVADWELKAVNNKRRPDNRLDKAAIAKHLNDIPHINVLPYTEHKKHLTMPIQYKHTLAVENANKFSINERKFKRYSKLESKIKEKHLVRLLRSLQSGYEDSLFKHRVECNKFIQINQKKINLQRSKLLLFTDSDELEKIMKFESLSRKVKKGQKDKEKSKMSQNGGRGQGSSNNMPRNRLSVMRTDHSDNPKPGRRRRPRKRYSKHKPSEQYYYGEDYLPFPSLIVKIAQSLPGYPIKRKLSLEITMKLFKAKFDDYCTEVKTTIDQALKDDKIMTVAEEESSRPK